MSTFHKKEFAKKNFLTISSNAITDILINKKIKPVYPSLLAKESLKLYLTIEIVDLEGECYNKGNGKNLVPK